MYKSIYFYWGIKNKMAARQTRVSNASMMSFPEKLSRFSWALFIPMCLILAI